MIAITICTRGRPKMFARCLESLPPAVARISEAVFVVVVENDREARSREVAQAFGNTLDVVYTQEPEPGIPLARNRAVETALQRGAEWLIFLDDDEWVADDWLERFVAAREIYPQAEVFTGPVLRDYPTDAPTWLPDARRAELETGQILASAATNNTMVAARVFSDRGLGLRFEERLRYTGGSDTEIFLRFSRTGGQIVWVADAQVFEEYPPNRGTLRWHLGRNIRRSSAGVLIERMHGRSTLRYVVPRIFHCLWLGLGRMVQGVLLILARRRRGHDQIMRGILSLASAWGYLHGLLGLQSEPYRSIDGR